MSKAVMISIRPKWCEKICRGEKTIEVRKTRPKLETPFKCYIYCTQASVRYQTICGCHVLNSDELYRHPEQGIKHGDSIELMLCENYTKDNFLNGKVVGEFTCDRIYELAPINHAPDDVEKQACLIREEIVNYLKGTGYGWHISDLRIYDAPRKLSEFERPYECNECDAKWATECNACHEEGKIKRAPQSWCYVEEQR
jgi:predicted transcriptional regulator